jgi:4'-phosphopantetheinyl transferase
METRLTAVDLGGSVVHLWYVRPEQVSAPADLEACQRILTPEERAAVARFHFDVDRHDRLVARALLRTVLSSYADVEPSAWRFVSNAHGRPAVDGPVEVRSLSFSVSHTKGLIVCLVGRDRVLGVDAEPLAGPVRFDDIAQRYFAPREAAELATWPDPARRRRFAEYWTLKEAYVKARGLGLSIPLDQFSFEIGGPQSIAITFAPGVDDDPASWQFSLEPVSDEHVVAVATEAVADRGLQLREWSLERTRRHDRTP